MKRILSKIKKTYKNFVSGKSGFSLVELIVVIAIMAVMAAVLAPALLGYVEKSRAQKDDSAMNEMTSSIQLALADADIYDELVNFAVEDNYSCYCDGDSATNTNANRTITKSPDLWLFNDNARLLDETVYKPAGKMRGVTVTFKPNGKAEYILKDGIVNQIGNDSTKKGSDAGKTLIDTSFEGLYNRMRSTVGDTIAVSSQTYRNSDYTIFISVGTTGGSQADKQDAIQVYGQYNGTNLPEVASPIEGESQSTPRNDIVPENCTYTKKDGTVISANGNIPSTPTTGDTYEEGDYVYTYNKGGDYGTKWSVAINTKVTDKNKSSYGEILSEVAGQPITNMYRTFYGCSSLTTAPTIPSGVTSMNYTFYFCTSLVTAPTIPSSVTNMYCTFESCRSLTTAPTIPNNVTTMHYTFKGCTSLTTPPDMSNANSVRYMRETFLGCSSLTTAPVIPNSVTDMYQTFWGCTSLTTAPTIPNSVTNMPRTFENCTKLTTAPTIPNSIKSMEYTFKNCSSLTTAPTIPNSVRIMQGTFNGCTSLTVAPTIPNSVTNMGNTFQGCTKLTGTIEVNANPTYYDYCFHGTVKPITLTGSSTKLTALKGTATNGNVTIG